MLKSNKINYSTAAVLASLGLSACGGSDSEPTTSDRARLNLAVSDAPVDNADSVWVCFSAIELVGNGEGTQVFEIGTDTNTIEENDVCKDEAGETIANTRGINLLEFTGSESESLLSGVDVKAGSYGQLRLVMAEGSHVVDGDTTIGLRVPSNELKFDGLTLAADSTANYTVEFDLRMALVNPVGQDGYLLKPRGVRLVDNQEIGHIEGTIAEALLIAQECTVAPADLSEPVATVYLYPGHDLDVTTLADNGGSEGLEAYASTSVNFDGATDYNFEIGFVVAGDYTAVWTCNTNDDPEVDDDISLITDGLQEIQVSAEGEVTVITFGAE
ncbi:DUF4382 domain-containing protein [Pseudidiomarina aestuarii]|uniref:DUF4382 domain-containing protein n=1 Tax=Pseudidiomarina aestuarii TaxID=624146 RepID=UPI003A9768E0